MSDLIPSGPSGELIRHVVNQAIAQGQQLRQLKKSEEQRQRVYHRADETVYETRTRTVEVYYFD